MMFKLQLSSVASVECGSCLQLCLVLHSHCLSIPFSRTHAAKCKALHWWLPAGLLALAIEFNLIKALAAVLCRAVCRCWCCAWCLWSRTQTLKPRLSGQ
jgi:hypothetical protein